MPVQMTAPTPAVAASPDECSAVADLMLETEAPMSGAPVYSPPMGLLLAVILGPKEPKEPKRPGK